MKKNKKRVVRELVGVVASDKMQKTFVAKVIRQSTHPIFKKRIKQLKKFKVHDKDNTAKIGDTVKIRETRPSSRDKRWTLVSILEKAK
jgi:small subunit ribosomal protein S17